MKYKLPTGVTVKNLPEKYTKQTKLTFYDSEFGEFVSCVKALDDAGASTHPKAVTKRREATSILRYGKPNPGSTKEAREKASRTMVERFGVPHALQNPEILAKALEGVPAEERGKRGLAAAKEKYGSNPMQVRQIKEKQQESLKKHYGCTNPMQNAELKSKMFESASKRNKKSKGEREIYEFLQSLGVPCAKSHVWSDSRRYEIDMRYGNVGVELNGTYWHSEAAQPDKNYHKTKREVCAQNGIELLQIFDYEWFTRKNQVKSFIRAKFGKNEIKLRASKTEVREVEKHEAKQFLDDYHILGKCNFKLALGLYYKNELVALATFGKHHRNNKEDVLSRFVGKTNISVHGGLSKLCKHAKGIFSEFYTWVDLRFSKGESWIKLGWSMVWQSNPDYFYYDKKTGKVVSKQSMKHVKNERSVAKELGLLRVYDCGKLKLKF